MDALHWFSCLQLHAPAPAAAATTVARRTATAPKGGSARCPVDARTEMMMAIPARASLAARALRLRAARAPTAVRTAAARALVVPLVLADPSAGQRIPATPDISMRCSI